MVHNKGFVHMHCAGGVWIRLHTPEDPTSAQATGTTALSPTQPNRTQPNNTASACGLLYAVSSHMPSTTAAALQAGPHCPMRCQHADTEAAILRQTICFVVPVAG